MVNPHKPFFSFFLSLLAVLLTFFFQSSASSEQQEIPSYENTVARQIEDRTHQILQNYDPKALVFVRVKMQNTATQLPATPFTLQGLNVNGPDQRPRIEKISIAVRGQHSSLPVSIRKLIEDVQEYEGAIVSLNVSQLPEELMKNEALTKNSSPKEEFSRLQQVFALSAALACLLAGFFLLFFNGYLSRRQAERLYNNFRTELKESIDGLTPSVPVQNNAFLRAESFAPSPAGGIQLSSTGLRALFMDCYWSEFDNYASYLWENISQPLRQELLQEMGAVFVEYVSYFADKPAQNLKMDKDPAYLAPLPFERLDHAAVTRLAQAHPAIVARLSRIRFDQLQLSATEKIALHEQSHQSSDSDSNVDFSLLQKAQASKKRTLLHSLHLVLKNFEEETELLAKNDLTWTVKNSIVSLGWLLKLEPKEIEILLQPFSARDLASAWIGPEDVLKQLITLIPEKKKNLLQEYLQSVRPDRNSPTLISLHRQALQMLKERAEAA